MFGQTAGPGDVTVDRVGSGEAVRRGVIRSATLVDAALEPSGRVDVLVTQDVGRQNQPRLSLWRVDTQGRARRVWRTGAGAGRGVLARNGSRLAIAWVERPDPSSLRGVVRLAVGTDARGLRRSRTLTRAVGRFGEQRLISDLDITLSPGGSPTVAAVRQVGTRTDLVVALTTPSGRVRMRQRSPGVTGRVQLRTTGQGRAAVLLEDFGGDVESSECGGGVHARSVWAATRPVGGRSFGPLILLDQLPYACFAAGAQLAVGRGGQVAVAWGTGDERTPPTPPSVRVAVAEGDGFVRQDQPGRGWQLERVAFAGSGALQLLSTQPPQGTLLGGPLFLRTRAPDGTYGPEQPLASYSRTVAAVTGADGDVLTLLVAPDGRLRLVALR